ncbi:MAG: hypothetical protein ACLRMJ_06060 [Alistipes finegoldii]
MSPKKASVESLISFARRQSIKAAEINDYLKSANSEPLTQGRKLYDILMRNNVTFESLGNTSKTPKIHLGQQHFSRSNRRSRNSNQIQRLYRT